MSSTPILDIPPELLAMIFRSYLETLYPRDWSHDQDAIYGLITITHVCRAFRIVALSCSELWCNISLNKPTALEHQLHYSKNHPLRVRISTPSPLNHPEGWNYVQSFLPVHCGRIQELGLDLYHENMRTTLSKVWKSLPLLSSIRLSQDHYNHLVFAEQNMINLDAIPLPSLKRIFLSRVAIRLPWSNCENLTHLSIISGLTKPLRWLELMEILSRSPRLEFLELTAIHFDDMDEPDSERRIELPHLVRLSIFDIHVSAALALFDIISPTAHTSISFNFLPIIISHDQQLRLREIVCRLGANSKSQFWLHLVRSWNDVSCAGLDWHPSDATLHIFKSAERFRTVLTDLFFVKHLHLDFDLIASSDESDDIEENWDLTLAAFPCLVELTMLGCRNPGMLPLQYLSRQAETGVGPGRPLFCPKLQIIDIDPYPDLESPMESNHDIEQTMIPRTGPEEEPSNMSELHRDKMLETLIPELLKCLVSRVKLGAKVKTVKLKATSNLAWKVSRRFEGLVEELFVNGCQMKITN